MRDVIKLGIRVFYDESNINDVFSEKNIVYLLEFPDGRIYIGSTSDLATRIRTHCSMSNSLPLLHQYISKYKRFILRKICSFDYLEDAQKCEDRLIKRYYGSGILLNAKNGR